MHPILALMAAAGVGYLVGAVPAGYLVGRVARGVDLRQSGSGRTGTTNALRTLGLAGAAAVLLLDLGKGFAASVLGGEIVAANSPGAVAWGAAVGGAAAVIGHVRSIFLGFRGGRGVATGAGALLAQAPLALLAAAPVMLVAVWATRYVSLGSLLGALAAAAAVALLVAAGLAHAAAVVFAVAVAGIVVLAHSDNIERLRAGTERRLGERVAGPEKAGGG
ncbi:MAG TPA: glycerol-3-phosphate 1-O-acyltransferase PlsY [Candidatus Limnocylindria bacterium]|nr:glycerol-3-phosphate 1-O-acyltransferase PlsY [Candidatus Limnocylindria bacterium]